jgi:ubiquinone/menaquinone biosynthesis C-methylase UbiE
VSPSATQTEQSHALNDETKVFSPSSAEFASVSVQEGYERWAQTYDKTSNPLLALEERHLTTIVPSLVGRNVLDLGCGTGRWLSRLSSMGPRTVVGIDLSAAMLRIAGKKIGIRDRLVLGDCLQLPFRDSVFNFVLSSFSLNHIKDLKAVANEVARAVNLRGRLLICEMHPEAYARGWRTGFRDAYGAVQIETVSHSAESIISCFRSSRFAFLRLYDLFFGEPERPIFLDAGRDSMFASACHVPAIQVYEFRKIGSATGS